MASPIASRSTTSAWPPETSSRRRQRAVYRFTRWEAFFRIAREIYAIPEGSKAVTGIAIGYAGDPEAFSKEIRERDLASRERKPQRDFVFGASWGKAF